MGEVSQTAHSRCRFEDSNVHMGRLVDSDIIQLKCPHLTVPIAIKSTGLS